MNGKLLFVFIQLDSCKQTPLLGQKGILYKYADMDVNDWRVYYKWQD